MASKIEDWLFFCAYIFKLAWSCQWKRENVPARTFEVSQIRQYDSVFTIIKTRLQDILLYRPPKDTYREMNSPNRKLWGSSKVGRFILLFVANRLLRNSSMGWRFILLPLICILVARRLLNNKVLIDTHFLSSCLWQKIPVFYLSTFNLKMSIQTNSYP